MRLISYILGIVALVCILGFIIVPSHGFKINIPMFSNNEDIPIGIKAILSETGAQQAVDHVLGPVEKVIQSIEIPDVHLQQHVKVVGDVDVDLVNIKIPKCVIQGLKVSLQEATNSVDILADGVDLTITLDWAYKQHSWPHSEGNGTGTASISKSSIEEAVAISLTADHKPSFKSTKNVVTLNNIEVKIEGGSISWLVNLLESIFKNQIKDVAEKGIQQALEDQINNQLNQQIAKTSFNIPVPISDLGVTLEIDLSLPTSPKISKSLLTGTSKAETYLEGHRVEPPFKPAALPATMETKNYANVYATEWMLNDAGYTLHNSGKLKYKLTPDMVPAESPIKLNTTDLRNYIPDLYEKYPNYGVAIEIASAAPPQFVFMEGQGAQVSLNATMLFSVIKPGTTTETKAFLVDTLASDAVDKLAFIAAGAKLNVTGHIQPAKFDFKLLQSFMGDIDIGRMNLIVTLFLNNGFIPAANEKLAQGVPITLPPGLTLENPNLIFHKGYVSAGVNVEYRPPSLLNPMNPHHRLLLARYMKA